MLRGFVPGFGGVQVRVPKRPRAALTGAGVVNFAAASLIVEKDTIAAYEFDQAFADADQSDVFLLEFRHLHFQMRGHRLNFGLVEPNETGRARAAVAAAGACEI